MKKYTKHKLKYDKSMNKSNEATNKILLSNENIKNTLIIEPKNDLDINLKEYLNTDIDDMDYDDAIRRDKRTICEYFSNKIKSNLILLNTFFII